jgi:flagellin
MAMVINTNVASLNAQRNLSNTQNTLNTSLQRLSSGLRINSAKDDAAGLAITNRMSSQVRGLNQAVRNANDGISVAQTAEGALQEVTNLLQRMRELAVQSANDSNTADDRASIQLEVDELVAEVDRIAGTTSFNNRKILDGTAGTFNFQVGANANETIQVEMVNVRTNSLGQQAGITQSTSARVSLNNDAANAGATQTRGIDDVNSDTVIASGDLMVKIDGMSSVNIAAAQFGGNISATTTTSSLQDVNDVDYGNGIAKQIADRINNIREMELEDTTAGVEGTYLQDVYASAKTTFKASDITDAGSWGAGATVAADDAYIGAGSLDNGDLKINGVDIGAVNFKEKDSDGSLVTAINAKSDITGVTASVTTDGELMLTAEDGRDIVVGVTNATDTDTLFAGGAGTTLAAAGANVRITGQVTITAQDTITVTDHDGASEAETGFATGTIKDDNVQAVGTIANADVSTVSGANTLIESVDSALRQVDDMRAKLGAVQNRLESTIANLESVSENVSASRSRTLDADFASETANMTKAQILQQAGVAMLAQANQLPQAALSLLQ